MTNGNQSLVQDQVAPDVAANVPVGDPGAGSSTLPLRQSTEIQGDILAPFNKDHRSFLFLRFPNADQGRGWLGELIPRLAKNKDVADFNARFSAARRQNGGADPPLKAHWTSVSLTQPGLVTLAPALAGDLNSFGSFSAGSAARAGDLGDTNLSDPARWIFGRPGQRIDALLSVAADDPGDLQVELDKLRTLATKWGLITVFEQRGDTLPDTRAGHEHFGFKDGISQPGVRDFDPPDPGRPDQVQGHLGSELIDAGQFVLGQGGDAQIGNPPAWMKNGSFQVFRRLAQDVAGFWAQVTSHVHSLPSDDPMTEDLLAAKLVGRWRSGTPLERAPAQDNRSAQDPGDDNDFRYDDDPQGIKCPQFSHIRKVYPRNNEQFGDREHRILRRGIPFGDPFDPTAGRGHGVDAERGLLFNAYMASIENQFEFLQMTWANSPSFPGGETGPDPVIGDAQPRPTPVQIMRESRPPLQLDFQRFVHTTGSLYAFAPSLSALQMLASGGSQGSGLTVGGKAVLTANDVNLRAQPSIGAAILEKLQTGGQVAVVGGPQNADGHTWWNIKAADGQTGWSAGEFLKALGIAIGGTAVVTANDVNVRSAPALSGAIVAKLQTGNHVTVVGGPQTADGHTWWNVQTQDGHNGWSAADFLRAA